MKWLAVNAMRIVNSVNYFVLSFRCLFERCAIVSVLQSIWCHWLSLSFFFDMSFNRRYFKRRYPAAKFNKMLDRNMAIALQASKRTSFALFELNQNANSLLCIDEIRQKQYDSTPKKPVAFNFNHESFCFIIYAFLLHISCIICWIWFLKSNKMQASLFLDASPRTRSYLMCFIEHKS